MQTRKQYPLKTLKQWNLVVKNSELKPIDDDLKVRDFNRITNDLYRYTPEEVDFWKTPDDFVKNGGGDCEDFAIYKYFKLPCPRYISVGMLKAEDKNEFHAVLVVYTKEFGEWSVLDNRTNEIISMENYKKNFQEIFYCDEKGVYI